MNIYVVLSNIQTYLFPLNWKLFKIVSLRFETLFQAYCIIGAFISLAVIFNDYRSVQCVWNTIIDLIFLLGDATTDFNTMKGQAITTLFILSVFTFPIFYCGVFFNLFNLTTDELHKQFSLFSNVKLTLSAYYLSCFQTIIVFKCKVIYQFWNNSEYLVNVPSRFKLERLSESEIKLFSSNENLINEENELSGWAFFKKKFKRDFLGVKS